VKIKNNVAFGAMVCALLMTLATSAMAVDNGTVTVSGLVILKNASCLGNMTWGSAKNTVANLSASTAPAQCNLTDGSTAGQWRLPSTGEIYTIYYNKSQLSNVQPTYYWTSYVSVLAGYYGVLDLSHGQDGSHPQSNLYYVVPVRNP